MAHKVIRYTINLICLTLSISLTIYFFSSLSDNQLFRLAVVPATIIIECLAQLILSLARYRLRQRALHRALPLFICYAWYLIVFALFSGISFFVTEIAVTEKLERDVTFSRGVTEERWEQNNSLIETLNRQLETEAETGFGPRSRAIMEEINRLREEQREMEAEFASQATRNVEDEGAVAKISTFSAVAGVFRLSPSFLKVFVFGTIVMFIYIGLTLTNWDIDFEGRREKRREKRTVTKCVTGRDGVTKCVTDKGVTGVTQGDGSGVTGVTGKISVAEGEMSTCPECGTEFSVSPGKVYCSARCKQRAWRRNKQQAINESL